MGAPASLSRHFPTASKFSIAKPIGSISAWQLAHTGDARCLTVASLIVSLLPGSSLSVLSAGTFGGGGGGGAASRFSSTHFPRTTGDVLAAYEVTVRMLPCPSSPPRGLPCRQRDAPEITALHVWNPVVLRQPLVQERVVRRQQLEHAPVLAQDAVQEQLGLAMKRGAQRFVQFGKQDFVRPLRFEVAQEQPLRGEVRHHRFGARIGEHPPDLPFEHRRLPSTSARPPPRAARRPECCSRGKTTGATPARDR